MPFKLKNLQALKKSMTLEQKTRLLKALHSLKEGNIGGETDIVNPDNLVAEDEFTAATPTERNVIAKTFDTKADYDSYVNQRRGIEMTPKEQQSILGYKQLKPTQQSKFFVKYETTDDFGNNDTTIIKKLKDGNLFTWTAFSKHETANDEGNPGKETPNPDASKDQNQEVTVDDPIRITKTITFTDDSEGSNILSDFLQKLDI